MSRYVEVTEKRWRFVFPNNNYVEFYKEEDAKGLQALLDQTAAGEIRDAARMAHRWADEQRKIRDEKVGELSDCAQYASKLLDDLCALLHKRADELMGFSRLPTSSTPQSP